MKREKLRRRLAKVGIDWTSLSKKDKTIYLEKGAHEVWRESRKK